MSRQSAKALAPCNQVELTPLDFVRCTRKVISLIKAHDAVRAKALAKKIGVKPPLSEAKMGAIAKAHEALRVKRAAEEVSLVIEREASFLGIRGTVGLNGEVRTLSAEHRLTLQNKAKKGKAPKKSEQPSDIQTKKPFIVGINLAERGIEVRKLFYAFFARGLAKDGYDPEECLQEVYKGLLTRNNGTCPFDSRKSSFGHYVHIVTRCVLANYIRKEKRKLQFESTEASLGGGMTETAFSIEGCSDKRGSPLEPTAITTLSRSLGCDGPVEPALRLLTEGYSRREVISRLQVEPRWLDGVLGAAREALVA